MSRQSFAGRPTNRILAVALCLGSLSAGCIGEQQSPKQPDSELPGNIAWTWIHVERTMTHTGATVLNGTLHRNVPVPAGNCFSLRPEEKTDIHELAVWVNQTSAVVPGLNGWELSVDGQTRVSQFGQAPFHLVVDDKMDVLNATSLAIVMQPIGDVSGIDAVVTFSVAVNILAHNADLIEINDPATNLGMCSRSQI